MHSEAKKNILKKKKRTFRIRNTVRGNVDCPRLSVVKTNKHLYAQIIDDEASLTLVSASTRQKDVAGSEPLKKGMDTAKKLGLFLAEVAKSKNIERVRFDRGSHKYHGLVAALASGAREGGLNV